jgi:hypothetical protein
VNVGVASLVETGAEGVPAVGADGVPAVGADGVPAVGAEGVPAMGAPGVEVPVSVAVLPAAGKALVGGLFNERSGESVFGVTAGAFGPRVPALLGRRPVKL